MTEPFLFVRLSDSTVINLLQVGAIVKANEAYTNISVAGNIVSVNVPFDDVIRIINSYRRVI